MGGVVFFGLFVLFCLGVLWLTSHFLGDCLMFSALAFSSIKFSLCLSKKQKKQYSHWTHYLLLHVHQCTFLGHQYDP